MNPIIVLTGEGTASVLDNILSAVASVMKLSGDMLSYMASNPVYALYLASGFVVLGLAIFRKIRGTSRG